MHFHLSHPTTFVIIVPVLIKGVYQNSLEIESADRLVSFFLIDATVFSIYHKVTCTNKTYFESALTRGEVASVLQGAG